MAFRFVVLFALVSLARAGVIPSGQHVYSAPVYGGPGEYTQRVVYAQPGPLQGAAIIKGQSVLRKSNSEYDLHPQYKFGYDVQDSISGDSKRQVESRDGDVVHGEYSLIDADGYKRRVQYTADPVNGFNAIVTREPVNGFVKAVVAPVVVKSAVPVAYSAASLPVKYTNAPKQLYRSAAAAYENGPVVKGAYAETPIVKAVPVAYPISKEH